MSGSVGLARRAECYLVSPFPRLTMPMRKSLRTCRVCSILITDDRCLSDATFENGSTLFIPNSHKWQTRTDVPADAESMLIPFEAKAGSIVCMEGRIWHTSGKNITKDQDRALLFGGYNAAFLRGQINWAAGLSEETKKTLSEDMRDWLGVDAKANTGRVTGVNRVYG